MRIVQVIDSLNAGGAERMAVNYANSLSNQLGFSGLICTRIEGDLKNEIHKNVSYLFLNKTKVIDFKALFLLKKYCISNKITHLHAHSSSYFFSVLVKLFCFNLKIIWHDHYGFSDFLVKRKFVIIKICSYFFHGIVTVNSDLKKWAEKKLNCDKIIFLNNFVSLTKELKTTQLNGNVEKRIICLANLRPQKNHLNLLQIALKLKETHPLWTFHLVGKDFQDSYSKQLKSEIELFNLQNNVFLYDSKKDIQNCINQCEIGILNSISEGLPLSIIEYGLQSKAVISTNVGQIYSIIENKKNGFLIKPNDTKCFNDALVYLIENPENRIEIGKNLHKKIFEDFNENKTIDLYLNWLKN